MEQTIEPSSVIHGVVLVHLDSVSDHRGRFMETFRQEWFPGAPPMILSNRSDSRRAVLRGLHFHRHQADYWYAARGRLFVALHDLRRSSPTDGASLTFEIGDGIETGVYIPRGVAHGFQAITDITLTYLVDRYYDPSDELGIAWDDPDAAIPWPLDDPILSERDKKNPKRADLTADRLPE
ncbi:MAG: dTDP-4-dehydrorhamnose 3,5-epimerase family protein [Candidatus Binatia bacterium]